MCCLFHCMVKGALKLTVSRNLVYYLWERTHTQFFKSKSGCIAREDVFVPFFVSGWGDDKHQFFGLQPDTGVVVVHEN